MDHHQAGSGSSITYRIVFSKRAQRQFNKLNPQVKRRLQTVIDGLESDPMPHNSSPMKYTGGERKIRVGDYRIVYEIGTQELIVLILKIGDRKDVYE